MELIHIANATFSSNKKSRLKWASKQKTFRIVKEHARPLGPRAITRTRTLRRARVIAP